MTSFFVEDNLVQSYDEHISPVLGGNDTLRNEQKRKRHLEAWSLSVTSSDFLRSKTRYSTTVALG